MPRPEPPGSGLECARIQDAPPRPIPGGSTGPEPNGTRQESRYPPDPPPDPRSSKQLPRYTGNRGAGSGVEAAPMPIANLRANPPDPSEGYPFDWGLSGLSPSAATIENVIHGPHRVRPTGGVPRQAAKQATFPSDGSVRPKQDRSICRAKAYAMLLESPWPRSTTTNAIPPSGMEATRGDETQNQARNNAQSADPRLSRKGRTWASPRAMLL